MNKKFLIGYGVIIATLLIFILFIAPDKMFIKSSNSTKNTTTKEDFKDYKKQQKELINNNYKYHFDINYNSKTYKCSGAKDDNGLSGECSEPKKIKYNQDNINDKLTIDTNYLNPEYVFDLIKDIEPILENLYVKRYYTYNVKLVGLDGKIIVYTDTKHITQISIMNGYYTYSIYYEFSE